MRQLIGVFVLVITLATCLSAQEKPFPDEKLLNKLPAFENMDYKAWEKFELGSWVIYAQIDKYVGNGQVEQSEAVSYTKVTLLKKLENGLVLTVADRQEPDTDEFNPKPVQKPTYHIYDVLFVPKTLKTDVSNFQSVPPKFEKLKGEGSTTVQSEVVNTKKAKSSYNGKHVFEYAEHVPGWAVKATFDYQDGEQMIHEVEVHDYHLAEANAAKSLMPSGANSVVQTDYLAWEKFEVGAWAKSEISSGEVKDKLEETYSYGTTLIHKDKDGLVLRDVEYEDGKITFVNHFYMLKNVWADYDNWYFLPNYLASASHAKQFKVAGKSIDTKMFRSKDYLTGGNYSMFLNKKVPGWMVSMTSIPLNPEFPFYEKYTLLDYGLGK